MNTEPPKQHSLIFSQEMVKSLLNGKKTVARIHVKLKANSRKFKPDEVAEEIKRGDYSNAVIKPGDVVWVRETFKITENEFNDLHGMYCIEYRADSGCKLINPNIENNDHLAYAILKNGYTSSSNMPRYASRLTLKVTGVRIERVQDISEEQAIKEGMPSIEEARKMAIEAGMDWYQKPSVWFKGVWDRAHSDWEENPLVWCIEFDVIGKNIDLL